MRQGALSTQGGAPDDGAVKLLGVEGSRGRAPHLRFRQYAPIGEGADTVAMS